MKKIFVFSILYLFLQNASVAESYYFKNCKISNAVTADYIINLDKNIINVSLKALDGKTQNFSDKIKNIGKNKIISEKIKSARGSNLYYQYFLNSKSNSVIKLQYKKEKGADIEIFRLKEKKLSYCLDVKADWEKRKIDEAKTIKKQKQILKAQEQIKKEQSSLIVCQEDNYKKWNNCKGSYEAKNRRKYSGMFIDGQIIKGFSIYSGGAKYVGEFKEYEPHGYGTFFWTNGDKYYGEWKNGKSDGNGTKVWKNGRKYSGTFKNDELHGSGVLTYPDGKKYEGEFINGKRHGKGTFTYADGSAYIGKFIAGKEDGEGECISAEGLNVPCRSKSDTQAKDFSGKDIHKISIIAKKWVRISQYESNTKKGKKIMSKLKVDFENRAAEICISTGSYNVLSKQIEVLEVDETPAYGLETKLKIGINGAVECK